jgi:hypothetical protein
MVAPAMLLLLAEHDVQAAEPDTDLKVPEQQKAKQDWAAAPNKRERERRCVLPAAHAELWKQKRRHKTHTIRNSKQANGEAAGQPQKLKKESHQGPLLGPV